MRRTVRLVVGALVAVVAVVGWSLFDRHAAGRLAGARTELAEALRHLEAARPNEDAGAAPRPADAPPFGPAREAEGAARRARSEETRAPRAAVRPAESPPAAATVAGLVRRASAAVVPERDAGLQTRLQGLHDVPAAEWLEEERDLARHWLAGQREALSLIDTLSDALPLAAGSWGEDLSREGLGILRLSLVVGLDARSSPAGGRVERQTRATAVLLAVSRSLCAEPGALSLTLGSGVERLALAEVRDLLSSGLWKGAALGDLRSLVAADPCAGAVEETYRVESERLIERSTSLLSGNGGPLVGRLRRPWTGLRRARVLGARAVEVAHLGEPYADLLRRHDEAFRGAGDGSIVQLVDIAGTARAVESARRIALLALEWAHAWPEPPALHPGATPYTGEVPTVERRDGALVLDLPESRRYFSQYEEDAPRGRADTLFRWTVRPPPAAPSG